MISIVATKLADPNQSPSSIIHPLCLLYNPSLRFHVHIHPNLHTAQSPLQYAWRTWQVEYIPGIIVVVLWNKNVIMLMIFVTDCTQRTFYQHDDIIVFMFAHLQLAHNSISSALDISYNCSHVAVIFLATIGYQIIIDKILQGFNITLRNP